MIFGNQKRKQSKRDYESQGHEQPPAMRTKNGRAADDANDYAYAGAGIVERLPEKIKQASRDAEKRPDRIKDQCSRSGAQQGKRNQREDCAQLQSAPALAFLAHSTQIIFGMRRHHSRKVMGQFERTRLIKSEVQSAKQLPLGSEFSGAINALFQVRLESLQRGST